MGKDNVQSRGGSYPAGRGRSPAQRCAGSHEAASPEAAGQQLKGSKAAGTGILLRGAQSATETSHPTPGVSGTAMFQVAILFSEQG